MTVLFDYGCAATPGAADILQSLRGVAACLAIFIGLVALGRMMVRADRVQPAHLFSGWAVTSAVLTIAGMASTQALWPAGLIVMAAMTAGTISAIRRQAFTSAIWLAALCPGVIILIVLNLTGIAKWDDFSHWVPNALYLFQYNSIPHTALPPPHSVWPGYPYALPFLTYLAAQLAGGFVMQGGALFNFLMLLGFAGMLAGLHDTPAKGWKSFGVMSVALLIVTLANPGFNASFTMTSQGDTGTMAVTGALGLLLWRFIDALKDGHRPVLGSLHIEIALLAVLLLLIKQGNIALLGLLMIGFLIVAARNRLLPKAVAQLPALLLLAIIVRLAWDHYVGREIAGNGFQLRPLAQWRFDLLGPLLQAMGHEALRKSGSFGLILLLSISGIVALARPATRQNNLLILAATVSGGYVVFLACCYLGTTFNEIEIRRAASFYRYNTHTSLLNLAVLWLYAPTIGRRLKVSGHPTSLKIFALSAASILPLALLIHRAWLVPDAGPMICAYRAEGRAFADALPDHSRIGVDDPEGDGLRAFVMQFELGLDEARTGKSARIVWQRDQLSGGDNQAQTLEQMTEGNIDTLYIPQAIERPVKLLGLSNHTAPLILRHSGDQWLPMSLPAEK